MAKASFESVAQASEERGEGAESKPRRVSVEFTPEAYARLAEIRKLAGSGTNADVFRKALQVLEWLLKQQKDGARLQVVKDGTVNKIELLL